MTRIMVEAIAIGVSIAMSGAACAQNLLSPSRFATPPPDAVPLTQTIAILADIQQHEEAGKPIMAATTAVDKLIGPTIRPAEETLFSGVLTALAVKMAERPVVVLGDVMDVSCHTEWQRVRPLLMEGRQPVLIAPGNHDGFYMGNYSPQTSGYGVLIGQRGWDARCERGGRYPDGRPTKDGDPTKSFMDKSEFIAAYLQALAGHKATDPQLASCLRRGDDGGSRVHSCAAADASGFVQAVAIRLYNDKSFQQSFLLQRANLSTPDGPPASLYMLDTAQYANSCTLLCPHPAGVQGDLQEDQFKALEEWLNSAPAGEVRVFAGHHPLHDWTQRARNRFFALLDRRPGEYVFISAHTHKGNWFQWQTSRSLITELNTGSMIDYPVYWRSFALSRTPAGTTYVRSTPAIAEPVEAAGGASASVRWMGKEWLCDAAWQESTDLAGKTRATLDMRKSWRNVMGAQLDALYAQLAYAPPQITYFRWRDDGSTFPVIRATEEVRRDLLAVRDDPRWDARPTNGMDPRRHPTANAGLWIAQLRDLSFEGEYSGIMERYRVCKAVFSALNDRNRPRDTKSSATEKMESAQWWTQADVRLDGQP